MIIADLIRRAFATHADRPAISSGAHALTYAQVADRSYRLVNALRDRGIQPGDRVATLAPNNVTSLELMTGLALGGYARTALHAMNSGDAHREMLEASGARVLFTTREFAERFHAELATIAALEYVVVLGADHDDALDYEKMLAASDPTDVRVPVNGDTILHLAYSSGSTGTPRASVHTHESWMAVTADHAIMLPRVTSDDVYLAAAPLTHAASTVLYLLLGRGASIQILEHFDPADALRLIERERCSLTVMVPTMLAALATHPDVATFDLSSMRAIVYAGAPISAATARAAQHALGDVLFQTYGQSECLPVSCLTPADHALGVATDERILTSAGRPCLDARLKIVDDAGEPVGPGHVGEILVSTRGQMRGIYGDPIATTERITADGFVRTNDIGYLDDRGLLFVVDRKNDMIISGGFNIWPAEIETALLRHPDVVEAIAIGIPHPRWGETPVAIVVTREDSAASADELIELCKTEIGSMKKPTEILLRTEPLPRNEFGKLSRRALREQFWPAIQTPGRQVSGA